MKTFNRAQKYLSGNLKRAFYKRRFFSVGNGLEIVGRPVIHGPGKIRAGSNLYLRSLVFPIEIFAGENASINIGNNVVINQGVIIGAILRIDIGDSTIIGDQTIIYDTDWHGIDERKPKASPVTIGNHVWLGARVIILKGVTIGDNSIVGAGSVVTRNVDNNKMVAGNPAKEIGSTKTGYA